MDLIAQGPRPEQRWRRRIPAAGVELGRTTPSFAIPWDRQISRVHAHLKPGGSRLHVLKSPQAGNPVFYGGKRLDSFWMVSGDHFVIGQTTFLFSNEKVELNHEIPGPENVQSFSHNDIRQVHFSDSDRRLRVLNDLPEIIASASNDSDLFVRVCSVLLAGVRSAHTAAIVRLDEQNAIDVYHWDRRNFLGMDFTPSERLIRRAIQNRETVLHFWDALANDLSRLTIQNEQQWAFVSPLSGTVCHDWAFYLVGDEKDRPEFGSDRVSQEMQSDIKFAELVGAMVSSVRDVQILERNQSTLRTFFSPIVMESVAGRSLEEALSPRKCEISVLFCDLRGFSRKSEEFADNLLELLDRVSQALGITTQYVLQEDGVIGDFHGDAVMGFWGWPLDQEDRVDRACRAALAIEREFQTLAKSPEHQLAGFRIGIGISSGSAVAGRIGTSDQVKVTAFGPTVNIAARLESMTKLLRVPVLIDEDSMQTINANPKSSLCGIRLARVRPAGMNRVLEIGKLVSVDLAQSVEYVYFDHALNEFSAGNWNAAREKLNRIPTDSQLAGPVQFLREQMPADSQAPVDFSGVIDLTRK